MRLCIERREDLGTPTTLISHSDAYDDIAIFVASVPVSRSSNVHVADKVRQGEGLDKC